MVFALNPHFMQLLDRLLTALCCFCHIQIQCSTGTKYIPLFTDFISAYFVGTDILLKHDTDMTISLVYTLGVYTKIIHSNFQSDVQTCFKTSVAVLVFTTMLIITTLCAYPSHLHTICNRQYTLLRGKIAQKCKLSVRVYEIIIPHYLLTWPLKYWKRVNNINKCYNTIQTEQRLPIFGYRIWNPV